MYRLFSARFGLLNGLPPTGKELTVCSLCILTICYLSVFFCFGFEGEIWVLIDIVPGQCLLVTFKSFRLMLYAIDRNLLLIVPVPGHNIIFFTFVINSD